MKKRKESLWVKLTGERLCDYYRGHNWEIYSWKSDLGMGTEADATLKCSRCELQITVIEVAREGSPTTS